MGVTAQHGEKHDGAATQRRKRSAAPTWEGRRYSAWAAAWCGIPAGAVESAPAPGMNYSGEYQYPGTHELHRRKLGGQVERVAGILRDLGDGVSS